MEKVAVIMTVHNRRETTLECLSCLYGQTQAPPFDVYLTDDGCTDGTAEAVAAGFPEVNILKGNGSLYWNGGMRSAWEEACRHGYDAYLWLNDDTMLYRDSLSKMVGFSSMFSDRAVIVGNTCDSRTGSRATYGGRDARENIIVPESSPAPCVYMNGNVVLIPGHVVDAVGLNDSRYTHAMGDYDYSLRVREAGLEVMAAPGFMGVCDLHEKIPVWSDPSKPLRARWKSLFSPSGSNPFEYFYYRRRHFGLLPACMTFVSNMVHVLFPSLWRPMETSGDGRLRLLMFHPALLPYRVDFFNRLAEDFDAHVVFLSRNNRNQGFDQDSLRTKCTFEPEYLDHKLVIGDRDINTGYLKKIRQTQPDIVFGSEYGLSVLVPLMLKKLFRFRYRLWTMCDDSLDIASSCGGLRRLLRGFVLKNCDGVLFISQDVAQWYSEHLKSSAQYAVLPIVREDAAFRKEMTSAIPTAERYLDEYGLRGHKVVLFVGRFVEVKNLPFLLKAFSGVPGQDVRLVLVGDGDMRADMMALAREAGCADRVLFPGRFEGEALLAWYQLADLFVLPSTYEPFGAVTAEALQAGVPVLCSSAAGSSCLIKEDNGMLFPPHDLETLKKCLRDALDAVELRSDYGTLRGSMLGCSFTSYMDQLKSIIDSQHA
ncbi:MAG: glycosyltransferase [Bacteroidales bacterium]|nr:glycosyltransferase [Candidatus Cryptobacteroides onthequi]